jgi:hypothetical protein
MNHLETVLTARLHDLADEMTPVVDPRRQVADARARNHRQRRGRIALVAVATAAAAVVVGSAVAVDLISAGDDHHVAVPHDPAPTTAPATTEPVPTTEPAPTTPVEPAEQTDEPSTLPDGWEPRSFLGVSFAVPPGARMPDYMSEAPPIESDGGPGFGWAGPQVDDWGYEAIAVTTDARGYGAFPAPEGAEPITVPGAQAAWLRTDTTTVFNPSDSNDTFEEIEWNLTVATEHRRVRVTATFRADAAGEEKARQVIESVAVDPDPFTSGRIFAFVLGGRPWYTADGDLRGALTVQPAEWLGSGPGAPQASQVVAATDGPYVLQSAGSPTRSVDFRDFISVAETETNDRGPIMGWLTVRDGVVVGFEQVR